MADSSGGGRNFTARLGPATRDTAAIGGHDAVKFDATPMSSASNAFSWGTATSIIEIVTRIAACSGECPLWSSSSGNTLPDSLIEINGADAGGSLTLRGEIRSDSGMSAPFSAGVHVVGLRRTGATAAEIRVDGTPSSFTLSSSYDFSSPAQGALGVYENSSSNTTTFLTGEIAEVIAASDVSDADIARVELYLKTKYGL